MYKRICDYCGTSFETDDIELDYCSIECYYEDEKRTSKDQIVLNEIDEAKEYFKGCP